MSGEIFNTANTATAQALGRSVTRKSEAQVAPATVVFLRDPIMYERIGYSSSSHCGRYKSTVDFQTHGPVRLCAPRFATFSYL
jgi:hypothetical protein